MSISAFTDISGCKMVIDSHVGTYTDAGLTPATANTDIVQQINDQSGQANHWTQTGSSSLRAIIATDARLNKRVLQFDGSVPQYYNLPNFLSGLTAASVFWLMKPNAIPSPSVQKSGFHYLSGVQDSAYPYVDGNLYDAFGETLQRIVTPPVSRSIIWGLYYTNTTTNLRQLALERLNRTITQSLSVTVNWRTTPIFGKSLSGWGFDGQLRLGVLYDSILTDDQYFDVGEFIQDNYLAEQYDWIKQSKLDFVNPPEGGDCEWAFPIKPIGDAVGSGITRGYPLLF